MSRRAVFSAAEDETLIELVANHRMLWDMSDDQFKNAFLKERVWGDIGVLLDKPAEKCKKRWRNIRDYYKKTMQHQKANGRQARSVPKRAVYWSALDFLDDVQDERDVNTDSHDAEDNDDPQQVSMVRVKEEVVITDVKFPPEAEVTNSNTGSSSTKQDDERKKNSSTPQTMNLNYMKSRTEDRVVQDGYSQRVMQPDTANEIDLFFKGISATVQNFDDEMRAEVKGEIFSIVTKYELQHIRKKRMALCSPGNHQQQSSSSSSANVTTLCDPTHQHENFPQ